MRFALCIYLFTTASVFGQTGLQIQEKRDPKAPFLYLNKIGSRFQLKIYENENIRFKLKGTDIYFSGRIEYFRGQKFSVHQTEIPISEISEIDIRHKNFKGRKSGASGAKLIIASLLLPTIDFINGGNPFAGNFGLVSAGLLVSGVFLKLIDRKYFEPGSGYKLVIIHPGN